MNDELAELPLTDVNKSEFEPLVIEFKTPVSKIVLKFPLRVISEEDFLDGRDLFTESNNDIQQLLTYDLILKYVMLDCLAFYEEPQGKDIGAFQLVERFRKNYFDEIDIKKSVTYFNNFCKLNLTEFQSITDYYISYILDKTNRVKGLQATHETERKALEREKMETEERIIKRADLKVKQSSELAVLESELKNKYRIENV